jgi:hypothetical protein
MIMHLFTELDPISQEVGVASIAKKSSLSPSLGIKQFPIMRDSTIYTGGQPREIQSDSLEYSRNSIFPVPEIRISGFVGMNEC